MTQEINTTEEDKKEDKKAAKFDKDLDTMWGEAYREARSDKIGLDTTLEVLHKLLKDGILTVDTKLLDVLKAVKKEQIRLDKTI